MMAGGDEEKATAPKPTRGNRNPSGSGNASIVDETPPGQNQEMDERTRAVADQTSDVVWYFMRDYNELQVQRSNSDTHGRFRHTTTQTDDLLDIENVVPPVTSKVKVPEFDLMPPPQDQRNIELAHNLRRIAADMEQTYRPTVTMLVNKWLLDLRLVNGGGPLTFDSVWMAFRRVTNAVLQNGVSWGKVLLLLLFAYEIAVTLYVENVPGFIRQVITSFIGFLIESRVVKWIADHGGWAAATTALWFTSLRVQAHSAAPYLFWLVGIGALILGTVMMVKRK